MNNIEACPRWAGRIQSAALFEAHPYSGRLFYSAASGSMRHLYSSTSCDLAVVRA